MKKIIRTSVACCIAFLVVDSVHAGPVEVNGVRYKNTESALSALQRSAEIALEQTPPDYLKTVNVSPIGGRFTIVLPSLDEAQAKYVWVSGGIFKPGNETQKVIAEGVRVNIKLKFLVLQKIKFIDFVEFVESSTSPSSYENTNYIIKLQTDFDGQRTQQAQQFRQTDWVVTSKINGVSKVAFSAYGSPTSVDYLNIFSGMRAAISEISK